MPAWMGSHTGTRWGGDISDKWALLAMSEIVKICGFPLVKSKIYLLVGLCLLL